MSKYDKLARFLHGQPQEWNWHTMSFGEVEDILGFPMPASARKYRAWWANQSDGAHVQAQAWMCAGWRVSSVDLPAERIEFERVAADPGPGVSDATAAAFHHPARSAAVVDMVTFNRAKLGITARRILDDYTAEFDGDVQAALDKALHEARVASRQRLIDSIVRTGPPSTVSSVDLIREDRDAR